MDYKGKAAMFVELPFMTGGIANYFPNTSYFDYIELVNYIEKRFEINIHIKTIYMPEPEQRDNYNFRLRDRLSHLGFCVKLKPPFYCNDSKTGVVVRKCNFDSKISLDMYKLALLGKVDFIILLGSDIDYFEVLEEIHELGVHTIVFGFRNTVADIRNIADDFIFFESIKDIVVKQRTLKKEDAAVFGDIQEV